MSVLCPAGGDVVVTCIVLSEAWHSTPGLGGPRLYMLFLFPIF